MNQATVYFMRWCDQRAGRLPMGIAPMPLPEPGSLPHVILIEPPVPSDSATGWILFILGFVTLGLTWLGWLVWFPVTIYERQKKRTQIHAVYESYRAELAQLADWYGITPPPVPTAITQY